jgi:MoaA/NifB/PqqE/SkfB family radical SAM enzyme
MLAPSLDWIQVEVTSHCNARCAYCPRTVYGDDWLSRHMSMETFERLVPAFRKTRLVFLQGWGEPFLHPELLTMMATAKRAGCKVGTTTNGMLLDAHTMHRLVEIGVDVLAFSLAGADERNDAIRSGTRLADVLDAIRSLGQIKRRLGKERPEVHVAYMLLRSGLEGVRRLPHLLQALGVSQVVISTLDFVASGDLAAEAVVPATPQEYENLAGKLDSIRAEGERFGLRIHDQLYRPGPRRAACPENVERSLFVSADGGVSACVFANMPVSRPAGVYRDGPKRHQRVVFGNVGDAPPAAIWRRKAYRAFRRALPRGRLPAECQGCPKLHVGSRP